MNQSITRAGARGAFASKKKRVRGKNYLRCKKTKQISSLELKVKKKEKYRSLHKCKLHVFSL